MTKNSSSDLIYSYVSSNLKGNPRSFFLFLFFIPMKIYYNKKRIELTVKKNATDLRNKQYTSRDIMSLILVTHDIKFRDNFILCRIDHNLLMIVTKIFSLIYPLCVQ